jgi:hypothetical protein
VDADVPSDDPLVGHPWAHEILQCSDLEKMLTSLLPKEIKTDVQEKEAEKAWLHGAAGKMSGKEDADPFAGLAVKKSKGGKKAAAGRLVLTMDTVAGLAAAGVAIPTTAADIPACLATVSPAGRSRSTPLTLARVWGWGLRFLPMGAEDRTLGSVLRSRFVREPWCFSFLVALVPPSAPRSVSRSAHILSPSLTSCH